MDGPAETRSSSDLGARAALALPEAGGSIASSTHRCRSHSCGTAIIVYDLSPQAQHMRCGGSDEVA